MSIKAYKYRIDANKATTEKLHWVLDRCRELYNAGLQERRDAYEAYVKRHPNYYDETLRKQVSREHGISVYEQKRDLVEIKESRPEYWEIASHVLQDVLFRLQDAFDDFFRRVKNGEKAGYPRFQGRNRYDSFCYPDGAGWKLDASARPADKKGMVRVHLRLTRKIANQRKDFHQKASRKLVNQYQVIAFEDLQVKSLTKAPAPKQDETTGQYLPNGASAKAGLNKSILDAGWSTFTEMVSVKAAWAGRTAIFVNPFKTSQICSQCLKEEPHKALDERVHSCIHCGVVLDRDTNAAINILNLGYKTLLGGTRPTRATA